MRIKAVFDPDWLLNPGKVFPLDAVAAAMARRDSGAVRREPRPARPRRREESVDVDEILKPATEWELKSMMAALAERQIPVEIIGAGSKRGVGRPDLDAAWRSRPPACAASRSTSRASSSCRRAPARPLSQIEVELASRGQMLPFEPIDLGPAARRPTPACRPSAPCSPANLSGARRIAAGAARDFLLGVRGVNGRGEMFKSGGRVMKNVTGYDVARGLPEAGARWPSCRK